VIPSPVIAFLLSSADLPGKRTGRARTRLAAAGDACSRRDATPATVPPAFPFPVPHPPAWWRPRRARRTGGQSGGRRGLARSDLQLAIMGWNSRRLALVRHGRAEHWAPPHRSSPRAAGLGSLRAAALAQGSRSMCCPRQGWTSGGDRHEVTDVRLHEYDPVWCVRRAYRCTVCTVSTKSVFHAREDVRLWACCQSERVCAEIF
jgi:hypothetical protein